MSPKTLFITFSVFSHLRVVFWVRKKIAYLGKMIKWTCHAQTVFFFLCEIKHLRGSEIQSDVLFSFKCEQRLFVTLKGHIDITEQIKGTINTSHTRGLEK